jgi:hypothetical protein
MHQQYPMQVKLLILTLSLTLSQSFLPVDVYASHSFIKASPKLLYKIYPTVPPMEITLVNMRYRRPPLVELSLDVLLYNRFAETRWFILPSNIGGSQGGGIDGVRVYQIKGKGRVVMAEFYGTGGFQAILLPPDATVKLKNLPINYWKKAIPGKKIQIDGIVAKQVMIGGEPIQNWFEQNPISDLHADVDMIKKKQITRRTTKDNSEVPVEIIEGQRIKSQIQVPRK